MIDKDYSGLEELLKSFNLGLLRSSVSLERIDHLNSARRP